MAETFLDGKVTLFRGDCLELLPTLEENSIDSIVTDPPYGLQFMGREWDRLWRNETDADQTYVERTKGQLTSRARKLPDYSATKPEQMQAWHLLWAKECLRVLKPGAHLLAFSGTRTYHRMACAIEDAGFEIRDQIGWAFGQGFPKSHNIGNGWGTALKPAWEPIVLARKPLSEKSIAANVLRWGTGALNIDATRIKANQEVQKPCPVHGLRRMRDGNMEMAESDQAQEMANDMRPQMSSKTDEPRGEPTLERREVGGPSVGLSDGQNRYSRPAGSGASGQRQGDIGASASGSPDAWPSSAEDGNGASPQRNQKRQQTGKPRRNGLDRPLTGTPPNRAQDGTTGISEPMVGSCTCGSAQLGRWPANIITDGSEEVLERFPDCSPASSRTPSSIQGVTSFGAGNNLHIYEDATQSAARFFYTAKADANDRLGSRHPTVKPLDLIQYLVRLITPRGGCVLDPFAGTGTTGEASWREGMDSVLIEREPEYQADIVKRMGLCLSGPDERRAASVKQLPPDDLPMFAERRLSLTKETRGCQPQVANR